jgi:branched-chain amino acid transport system substrate-binding protein
MKREASKGVCIAAILAVHVAIAVPEVASADTIRIGAILPLTGNSASNGKNMNDGLQLAVDEINKRGGVNGSKIELIVEDSKSDPQAGVAGFNRIEAARQPSCYVTYLSSVGMALAPLAEEKQVVLVGLVTAAIDFTKQREWVYRYWPLGQAYIAPLVRMLQDLKVRKLGILYQNEEFGREQQQLMAKQFTSAGGIVTSESVELKDTDFRSKIARLKDREAIYLACTGNVLLGALQQVKEAGYQGSVLTPGGAANPALFARPELEGVYIAAPIIHNPSYLYAREASAKFEASYKKPFDQWAASGYDFITLLAGLLEDRKVSRPAVRDVLAAGFEYSGVFGHLRVRPGEHNMTFQFYPTQLVNGSLKYR